MLTTWDCNQKSGPTLIATESRTSTSHAFTRLASLRRALRVPPLCSMNIPQENKIFLDIPSYDKIVYSHLLKSPPLIEANGSPVVFPHRKPNAPKARMPYMFKTSSHEYITQSMPCPLL